jgi:serine protease
LQYVGLFVAALLLGASWGLAPQTSRRAEVANVRTSPPANAILASAQQSGDAYTALSATRILDTRRTDQTLSGNAALALTVVGSFAGTTVPSSATAVALNITATNTTTAGFLTVYPMGGNLPSTSSLNWVAGETVPNLVIVGVGSSGQVAIRNAIGSVDVVVDLEGYFSPAMSGVATGSYQPLAATRITDTRSGSGEANAGHTLGPGASLIIQVDGEGGAPTADVAAAVLNLTVTDTSAAGYLTAYPEGGALPLAANLNWVAGQTVGNRVVVPVSSSGQFAVYNALGSTDVVADLDGIFWAPGAAPANSSLFIPVTPTRVLDTRSVGVHLGNGGLTVTQPMTGGTAGIPSSASAVVANVTVTDTTAPSYLEIYPGLTLPLVSDLNWSAGQTVGNLDIAALSSAGTISAITASGDADLILDVTGYFTPASSSALTSYHCTTGGTVSNNVNTPVVGDPITMTVAGATCPLGEPSFLFFSAPTGSTDWIQRSTWTGSPSFIYDTTGWPVGDYNLMAEISNSPQLGEQLDSPSSLMSVFSGGYFLVNGFTAYYPQIYNEDCEEAALQMALEHEHISSTQPQILNIEGVDNAVPGIGPGINGDPDREFIGPPNGQASAGWEPGAYPPPISRAAEALGGDVLAEGQGITPDQLFTDVENNHSAVAWITFDFQPRTSITICAQGDCFPWAGNDQHAVTIVGIGANDVLILNPWDLGGFGGGYLGESWVPMSVFDAAYATYGDMAVVLK